MLKLVAFHKFNAGLYIDSVKVKDFFGSLYRRLLFKEKLKDNAEIFRRQFLCS